MLAIKIFMRIVDAVRAAATVFVIIAFAYMTIAVLAQVAGRYVFNYSIGGAVETATWAQIWTVMIGSGIAMYHNMHVRVDVLAAVLPLWAGRILSLAIAGAALWFLAIVVYGSIPLIRVGMIQTSPVLHVPMWVVYLCLPVGAVYFSLEIIASIIRRWDNPFGSPLSKADSHAPG